MWGLPPGAPGRILTFKLDLARLTTYDDDDGAYSKSPGKGRGLTGNPILPYLGSPDGFVRADWSNA